MHTDWKLDLAAISIRDHLRKVGLKLPDSLPDRSNQCDFFAEIIYSDEERRKRGRKIDS